MQNDPDGVVKQYTYDLAGNRKGFTLTRGGVNQISLAYDYDKLSRLEKVKNSGAEIAVYTYDQNGNRATLAYPQNQVDIWYEYNAANLVTLLENGRGGVVASSWTYGYRPDGNQTSKTNKDGVTTTYTYDRLGRLVRESDPDWNTIAYEYDALGNRGKMTVAGQNQHESYETVYRYDANNRLLEEVKTGHDATETTHYRYDRGGNQTAREWQKLDDIEKAKDTGRVLFTREGTFGDDIALELREYNGFGQLTRVFRDAVQTLYRYRPDGLRHSKATGDAYGSRSDDAITVHHWDGQNIVMEASGSGNVKARYLRGVNLIAQQIDGSTFYYLHNAHGDVVQRVDTLGNSAPEYVYDAFGNQRDAVKTDPNPFRYCGEYYDLETRNIYLRNRYYSPANGRFTREDVAQAGLNWYTYCGNYPVRYNDPSGRSFQDIMMGLAATMDKDLTDGFVGWTLEKITGKHYDCFDLVQSQEDYYLGRVIGHVISLLAGIGSMAKGILDIIAAIGAGGAATIFTGGAGAALGASISIGGVVIGAAKISYVGAVVYAASGNFQDDYGKQLGRVNTSTTI